MSSRQQTIDNSKRRQHRVRTRIKNVSDRPRLSVFISNTHVSAQIIDDTSHKTLVAASTVGQKNAPSELQAKAVWVGEQIAKSAKSAKIKKVVFDRGDKLYHGRIKALADAARAEGLEF